MARMRKKKPGVGRSAGKGVRVSAEAKRALSPGKKVSGTGQGAPKDVDKYIARLPEPVRSRLMEMRAVIRSAVPAEAVEIISYQIPAFKTKKVLVWYARFSKHCSLFPTASVIEEFRRELAGFKVSKGTVQFPIEKALPAALIEKMVKTRVTQGSARLRVVGPPGAFRAPRGWFVYVAASLR